MKVYDFDKTIYDGDSTIDFYLFCLKKKPSVLFTCTFTQFSAAVRYKLGRISKEKFKEKFFVFLKKVQADESLLREFWDKHRGKIKDWYLSAKQEDDVIISASPEFLLEPLCKELGVNLIASRTDIRSGEFHSLNCYGEEKVRRFNEEYPGGVVDEFYTDSESDMPMIRISQRGFFVKKDTITEYKKG